MVLLSLPPDKPNIHINPFDISSIEPQGPGLCTIHTRTGKSFSVSMSSGDVVKTIDDARVQFPNGSWGFDPRPPRR